MSFNFVTIFFLILGVFCFFYLLSQVTRMASGSAGFVTKLDSVKQDFLTGDNFLKEQVKYLEKVTKLMSHQNREIFEMTQQIIYQNTQILGILEKVESDRRRRLGL